MRWERAADVLWRLGTAFGRSAAPGDSGGESAPPDGAWLRVVHRLCRACEERVARATDFPGWVWAWAAGLSFLAVVLSSPPYKAFDTSDWVTRALQWKLDHPLGVIDPDDFCPPDVRERKDGAYAHLPKRTYRVTVPLLAHALGLDMTRLVYVQHGVAFLFLAGCLRLAERMTGDRVLAALVGAVHAFSFVGTWGFYDLFIFFDVWGYLLLLGCLFWLPVPLYAAAVVLAGFVDERAVVAAPLLMVFWACGGRAGPLDPARGVRPLPVIASLAAGVGLYAALRLVMTWWLALPASDSQAVGLAILRHNLSLSPISVPQLWEAGWLVVGAGLIAGARRPARVALLLSAWAPPVLAAFLVYDFSRSAAYSFPAFWVCLRWLADGAPRETVRSLCTAAAAGTLVYPTYNTMVGVAPMMPSLPKLG